VHRNNILIYIQQDATLHSLGAVGPCIFTHSNDSPQPDRPRPTALLPPRSYGKPEAAAEVDRLLMMGIRMPETCRAVFKRQAINLLLIAAFGWLIHLNVTQFIWKLLYMLRVVPPPIIRSASNCVYSICYSSHR